jgi:crooked neck
VFQDYERTRQIYRTAVNVVPHKQFTFAKLWVMFATFEVRRLDLAGARQIMGTAIGMCPKEALFKGYIQLEFDVSDFTTFYYDYTLHAFFSFENSIE